MAIIHHRLHENYDLDDDGDIVQTRWLYLNHVVEYGEFQGGMVVVGFGASLSSGSGLPPSTSV